MAKIFTFILVVFTYQYTFSQRILTSWSQRNIENYTKEMYDEAQGLTSTQLLEKNLRDIFWSEVFLTMNASVNHHSSDSAYLKELANQITNTEETRLKGTSRLIIWDRIITGDITFEGKGLVIDNDLFKVAGRANQILQNLTRQNFGFVTIHSTDKELQELKAKWLKHLSNEAVEAYKPIEYKNAKMSEVSSLNAVEALIVSLQENEIKYAITKKCLEDVYKLDQLPEDKGSPAHFCNPDHYTFAYLGILFGDEKVNGAKDANWWLNFWKENGSKLRWNERKGIYEVKK
ncbi:hypothetical protein L3C95_09455 [Chitinophaga filiformis]|uniref:hypothetical protein n=1 Tax=Chitinophaga filiformis TaxID=104663 RepID=UPI001F3B8DE2|nr:hypothetical protein [Chitinophaga filiformis]MCF6403099.1 hypothetical protein [Chitinophaga filiformis]